MPMTTVGSIPVPPVSLYRLTLPLTTGISRARAGLADALDRVVQVPPHVGVLGIGEIEAIGDRRRLRTGGDDVAGRLADGDHRALPRVERGVSGVAVGGEGEPERACRRRARAPHRRREGSPSHRRPGGRSGGRPTTGSRGSGCRAVRAAPRRATTPAAVRSAGRRRGARSGRGPGAVRGGAPSTSRSSGRSQTCSAPSRTTKRCVGKDDRDHVGMQVPALEDLLQRAHVLGLRHDQHALLRLAEHHLIRRHARLATRGARDVDVDAATTSMRELRGAPAEPGGTEILHRDHARIAGELETRLHEALLEKWVADLHGRAPRVAVRVEHHRREARAVDAVTTRCRRRRAGRGCRRRSRSRESACPARRCRRTSH